MLIDLVTVFGQVAAGIAILSLSLALPVVMLMVAGPFLRGFEEIDA
jgi:hypothetical protein|tara:strand:+ start:589 stop:726 length:138 start_codon:yes stop_codon:yes gene_type:complete